MNFKLSDEESEEKNGMVTFVVSIDEELLRRVEASEEITRMDEGPHSITSNETGKLLH